MSNTAKRARLTNENASSEALEFVVDTILNKRISETGRTEYLVKWEGYEEKDASWEPEENLTGCEAVPLYESQLKEKVEDPEKKSEKNELDGKQLRCIAGLTNAPGELHFLCKFSDETAMLLPAKEVNARYRPYVDCYIQFVKKRLEMKKSGKVESIPPGEDWPDIPEEHNSQMKSTINIKTETDHSDFQ